MYKVISQKKERNFICALKIVLKSAWQSEQQQRQQQDTSESASSSTRKLVQRVQREEQGNPTDNPEQSLVEKEEPEFEVDLLKELHKM